MIASTGAVCRVSSAPNAPCWKSNCTIGSLSSRKPTAAGTVMMQISRMPFQYAPARFSISPRAAKVAMSGNTTVATDTVKMPCGTSMMRLAKVSTDTADSFNENASERTHQEVDLVDRRAEDARSHQPQHLP
jgi:hypothetical protein